MKQDEFQAEVLAHCELIERRLGQLERSIRDLQTHVDKTHNDLQDQITSLATVFARAGIHLEEKPS